MDVRNATLEDAEAIAAVHVRSWEAAYRGAGPDAWFAERTLPRRTDTWRERLRAGENTRVFVACLDGKLVGFCGAAAPSRDEDAGERTSEIAALYVDPTTGAQAPAARSSPGTLHDLAKCFWRDVALWVFDIRPCPQLLRRHGFFA